MENNRSNRRNELDIDSFRNDEPDYDRSHVRRRSGGFVDLGSESQYGTGGHQASGANEIFADIQVSIWYLNYNSNTNINKNNYKNFSQL